MNTPPDTLTRLQTDFSGALFSDERTHIAAAVKAQGTLSAEQRVGIYRNSVHGILWQYLASLYSVCDELVGEKFFEQLSDGFIDGHPPTTPFLADYGLGFADFMRTYPTLAEMRWLADVAELEWARHLAWNTVNQPGSDFSVLATLNETQQLTLQFQLPDSMQLLYSPYAIHQIWLAHQPEDCAGKIPLEELQLQQDNYVITWRAGRTLQQILLSEPQWQFLSHVKQGHTLADLSEHFQEQIGTLLAGAIQQGWIISLYPEPQA